jgi:hypothetical protein
VQEPYWLLLKHINIEVQNSLFYFFIIPIRLCHECKIAIR